MVLYNKYKVKDLNFVGKGGIFKNNLLKFLNNINWQEQVLDEYAKNHTFKPNIGIKTPYLFEYQILSFFLKSYN